MLNELKKRKTLNSEEEMLEFRKIYMDESQSVVSFIILVNKMKSIRPLRLNCKYSIKQTTPLIKSHFLSSIGGRGTIQLERGNADQRRHCRRNR